MTQDSLVWADVMKVELIYSELSSQLRACADTPFFDELMDFWLANLKFAYQGYDEYPEPKSWFDSYCEAIDVAEGGSGIVALFRHVGLGEKYLYQEAEKLRADTEHYREYYSRAKLPSGETGNFIREGFKRTKKNIVEAWNTLYGGLTNDNLLVRDVVRNFDLDTGVDLESADGQVAFWA